MRPSKERSRVCKCTRSAAGVQPLKDVKMVPWCVAAAPDRGSRSNVPYSLATRHTCMHSVHFDPNSVIAGKAIGGISASVLAPCFAADGSGRLASVSM